MTATYGDTSAVIFFPIEFHFADHLAVGDLLVVVGWNIFVSDDMEDVGAFNSL